MTHIIKPPEMPFPKWCQSLTRRDDWIVLDTETTGLKGQIVELSIISNNGNVLFDRLIKATIPTEPGAAAVHHITEEVLRNEYPLSAYWPTIENKIKGKLIITYNAIFDKDRIVQSCHANSITTVGANIWMCAMSSYANYYREPGRFSSYAWQKLENACKQQGVERPEGQQHRAAFDALWTWRLIMKCAQLGEDMTTYNNWNKKTKVV